ncbi:MAG: hypothetical protein M0C28_05935 [Candidatus Moduliflexus flocculans]|nr:hypothetical protein [Candidatus Moduliflexus flocculans]
MELLPTNWMAWPLPPSGAERSWQTTWGWEDHPGNRCGEILAREAGHIEGPRRLPGLLKSQWRIEIERFTDRHASSSSVAPEASLDPVFRPGRLFHHLQLRTGAARHRTPSRGATWDFIILDEGQRIKNWEAKTSRIIKGLQLALRPGALGHAAGEPSGRALFRGRVHRRPAAGPGLPFLQHLPGRRRKRQGAGLQEPGRPSRRALEPILLRRTRGGVMPQLPPRTTEIRADPAHRQSSWILHHAADADHPRSSSRSAIITEMDLLRLQKALLIRRMAADSTFLVDKQTPGYSSKLERLDELLDRLCRRGGPQDRAVLGMDHHARPHRTAAAQAGACDFVRLDGSVPQKKRQQLVHRFQNEPDCKLVHHHQRRLHRPEPAGGQYRRSMSICPGIRPCWSSGSPGPTAWGRSGRSRCTSW